MTIKMKVTLSIALCFAVTAIALLLLLTRECEKNIDIAAREAIVTTQSMFNNLEENDIYKLSSSLEILMADPALRNAYMQRDRARLAALTTPLFKTLHERYGIAQWNFIDPVPRQTMFLRAQKPGLYGDIIRRATFQSAVQLKDFGAGLELGNTGFSLRVVHPYYDSKGTIIGYMELGEEIEHFIRIMKEQTGNEYALFIKKSAIDEKLWAEVRAHKGLPDNWGRLQNLVLVNATVEEGSLHFDRNTELIPDEGEILGDVTRGNERYVQGVFPVYDVQNQKVGGVVVWRDITKLDTLIAHTRNTAMVSIIVLMLCATIIVLAILNKLVFKRISAMVTNIVNSTTRVVGGDFDADITVHSNDEVGRLEHAVEQFRKAVVNTFKQLGK